MSDTSSSDSVTDRGRYRRKRTLQGNVAGRSKLHGADDRTAALKNQEPTQKNDLTNLDALVAQKVSEILSRQQLLPTGMQSAAITGRSDIVPLFDPEKSDLTSANWLHKIEQLGFIHNWDDVTKSYFMHSRLEGVAKVWYNSLRDYNKTWSEWKIAVLEAFPVHEHFIENLKKMMARQKRHNETMVHYYYNKCIMIRKCEISDINAVSCLIDGLPTTLQSAAKAGNYKTPEQLFKSYLSKLESDDPVKTDSTCFVCKKPGHIAKRCRYNNNSTTTGYMRDESKKRRLDVDYSWKTRRCNYCGKLGHSKEQCRLLRPSTSGMQRPVKSCTTCGKLGHLEQDCYYRKTANPPVVSTINRQVLNDCYYVKVLVNNIVCKGYLDTGSQINVAEIKLANLLSIKLEKPDTYITGFGNNITYPAGKSKVNLHFEDFTLESEVYFVDIKLNNDMDIIIGQPVINDKSVELVVKDGLVKLKQCQKDEPTLKGKLTECSNKIAVHVVENMIISPGDTKEVLVKSDIHGHLLIPARVQHNMMFSTVFSKNNIFKINVSNIGSKNVELNKNFQLTKAFVFSNDLYSDGSQNTYLGAIQINDVHVDNKINSEDRNRLYKLLEEYSFCFAANTCDLGETNVLEFEINLHTREPVFYKPYRLSENQKEILRSKVTDLLENGIIRDSHSSYASPAILIKKKNGDYRVAIDYRKLNKITVKDRYPLPNIEDHISRLKGFKYFCTLDMTQGYYQVPVSRNSIDKTAFVTPDGQYEFCRMPFGLCNAPATFQRLINTVLQDLRHTKVLIYLDDILIPSHSVEEGLEILELIFQLFKKANLKFNIDKCFFFNTSVEYLGYEVSLDGIKPGNQKIQAVANFPIPKTVHEVRQFLGLCSYFRKFVQNHALIVQPLQSLLKKGARWEWSQDKINAFEYIKEILTSKPLLCIFNHKLPTELHTDASSKGVASILMQKYDTGLKPIMYYSRATTKVESVYHSFELETLAVVESIKRFKIYLTGISFKIITDCNAVRHTFSKKDLNPRIARWWLSVQEYDFEILHRPGNKMHHVDALSRNICNSSILVLNVNDWLHCIQLQDEQIILIIKQLKDNPSVELQNTYQIQNDKLYRKTADGLLKLVIPKYAKFSLLKKFHDEMGHLGLKKCEELVKRKFWFKGMTRFIKKYVRSCMDCAFKHSQYGRKEGYLFPINKPSEPLDTWHIDHLGPFCKSSGCSYILMVVDSFSKFLFARPTRTTNSNETIYNLKDLFALFGTPKRIISDWGKAFKSKKFKEFCIEFKIKHILNTISSPRSNGQVERYNRTLLDALNTSITNEIEWFEKLPQVVSGINKSENASTGFTPHKLMFGFEANILGEWDDQQNTSNRDIDRQKAKENMNKQSVRMKKSFDSKRKNSRQYKIDDLVLWSVGNKDDKLTSRKTGIKFAGPYKIIKILGNDRYELQSLQGIRGYKRYKPTVSAEQLRPFTGGVIEDSSSDNEVNSTDELIDLLEG